MKKRILILAGGSLVLLFAAALVVCAALRPAQGVDTPPRLWTVPAFSCTDQSGSTVSDRTLKGHAWVAGFFFTGSTATGPMMMARMADLRSSIPDPNVRFVSISVDPENDTLAVLKAYGEMWTADERWRFVRADRSALRAVVAAMKSFVSSSAPIQHSGLFTLVDREGLVRGVYESLDDDSMGRLARDLARLTGTPRSPSQAERRAALGGPAAVRPEPEATARTPGAAIFAARGCVACHDQGRTAPPLAHWLGRTVVLANGHLVKADAAYVRESILDPGAKVVAGYRSLMPSYRGAISDEEIDQIVAYLKLIAD